jgi:hypothetical protein
MWDEMTEVKSEKGKKGMTELRKCRDGGVTISNVYIPSPDSPKFEL